MITIYVYSCITLAHHSYTTALVKSVLRISCQIAYNYNISCIATYKDSNILSLVIKKCKANQKQHQLYGYKQPKSLISVRLRKSFNLNEIRWFTGHFTCNHDWFCHLATFFVPLISLVTKPIIVACEMPCKLLYVCRYVYHSSNIKNLGHL